MFNWLRTQLGLTSLQDTVDFRWKYTMRQMVDMDDHLIEIKEKLAEMEERLPPKRSVVQAVSAFPVKVKRKKKE